MCKVHSIICRCFCLSMFRSVNIWYLVVLPSRYFGYLCFGLSTFWTVTPISVQRRQYHLCLFANFQRQKEICVNEIDLERERSRKMLLYCFVKCNWRQPLHMPSHANPLRQSCFYIRQQIILNRNQNTIYFINENECSVSIRLQTGGHFGSAPVCF